MSNRDQGFRVCVLSPEGSLDETATLAWQRAGVTNLRVCKSTDLNTDPPVPDAPDLVVLHHPDEDAITIMGRVHGAWPQVPVAVWSVAPSVRGAVEAIRHGAIDYLVAAPVPEGIEALIEKARAYRDRQSTAQSKPEASPRDDDWPSVLGQSPAMKRLLREVQAVAAQDATVLLQGETGSGKERVARLIHRLGGRAAKPFIVCNCSAIVATLAESELFGHEKGAFTGARRAKAGLFEAARGGTLFFDQVQELPLTLQPKLLRVLESGEFRRVGGNKTITAEARIVAATKRDLKAEVERGKFREDLYFRLAVVPVHVPPLRSRREDIAPLVERFLELARRRDPVAASVTLSAETLAALAAHDWPGNVRELRNVLDRAIYIATAGGERELTLLDLPVTAAVGNQGPTAFDAKKSYREVRDEFEADFERRYVGWLLDRHAGNISAAAREAKMDRKHLYDLARRHGLRSGRG